MTTGLLPSITDELVAELERECRRGADDHGGMGNDYDSALFDRIGDTLLALLAERAELKKDAGRWRSVREMLSDMVGLHKERGTVLTIHLDTLRECLESMQSEAKP